MAILNPYLQFAGNAREAIELYREVFGGELDLMTFGDMGAAEHGGESIDPHGVMHSMLTTEHGFTLMAADLPPGTSEFHNGSISLSGDEADVLRGYWDKLSRSGSVEVPLEKQMWGDVFGQCTDGFGVVWLVNIADAEAQPAS